MKRALPWLFSCVLCAPSVFADEPAQREASTPSDFAQGLTLEADPRLATQTLLLPIEVYRGTHGDLSDLSVFDANGQLVPFAVRALEAKTHAQTEELPVPIFPLYERLRAGAGKDVALHVERSRDGSVVGIHMSDAKFGARADLPASTPPSDDTRLVAYVLDASKLDKPATRIRLELEPSTESFTTPFTVEASDDLSEWHTLAEGAAVGRLSYAGQTIERQRIDIPPTRAAFLRLRWSGQPFPTRVVRALLESENATLERQGATLHLNVPAASLKDGVYEADLGGVLPLDSLQPNLPENVLVRAALLLSETKDASGTQVFEGSFYRLQHANTTLTSLPVGLAGQRARYIRLKIDPRTAVPGTGKLAFDVAYVPEQLLFVTRGNGPYTLAYGTYLAVRQRFSAAQLLELVPPEAREALPIESAKVVAKRTLGGAAALTPPPAARSYRMPILWAVLIAGAATLLILALRMLRKMR